MQTIIWVFSAMLFLLLIISFLPLGFTFKGRFTIVLVAFVLAFGGLLAVTILPLWQTLLVLLVLAFFASYLMDSRMGKIIYQKKVAFEDEISGDVQLQPLINEKIDKSSDVELQDLEEVVTILPSSITANLSSVQPLTALKENTDIQDDDILFLHERYTENQIDDGSEETEDIDMAGGYLSEIESLLLEGEEEKTESEEEDWLEELEDLSPIHVEVKTKDRNQLDDFELEVLFAAKEVAAGIAENKERNDSKKSVLT